MKFDQAALILHLSSSGQMQCEYFDQNMPIVRRTKKLQTKLCIKKIKKDTF